MIGYVILIVIAVSLSGLVFVWLNLYTPIEERDCQQGVSIIIEEVGCDGNYITYTIKNQGRFTIDGVQLRAGEQGRLDKEDLNPDDLSFKNDSNDDGRLQPGETATYRYLFDSFRNSELEVQALEYFDNTPILCSNAVAVRPYTCDRCFNGDNENPGEIFDDYLPTPITVEGEMCGGATSGTYGGIGSNVIQNDGDHEVYALVERGPTGAGTCELSENYVLQVGGEIGTMIGDPNIDNQGGTCITENHTEYVGTFPMIDALNPFIFTSAAPACTGPSQLNNNVTIHALCIVEQ